MISSICVESSISSTTTVKPISVSSTGGVVVIDKARLEKLLFIEKNYIQIIAEGVKNAIEVEDKENKK